jgi:HAD superfamily hydrolase (TIGR01509 family)
MIKAIFFDMMDVVFTNGLKAAIAEYGNQMNVDPKEIYRVIHDFDGWRDFTLGNISETEFYTMCSKRSAGFQFDGQRFFELFIKNTSVNDDVSFLIKKLSKTYTIGIISNAPKEWAEKILGKSNLKDYIKIKSLSGLYHVRKPDRKIFNMALDEAKVKADEAIYIDDRGDRVGGAVEAGINALIFKNNIIKLENDLKKFNLIY